MDFYGLIFKNKKRRLKKIKIIGAINTMLHAHTKSLHFEYHTAYKHILEP